MLWFALAIATAGPPRYSTHLYDGYARLAGPHVVRVALYDEEASTTPLWTRSYAVDLQHGMFDVVLEGGDAPHLAVNDDWLVAEAWIALAVDGGVEGQRTPLRWNAGPEFPKAPPPPSSEAAPGPRAGYVWVPGHHDWRNGAYAFVLGHWERARTGMSWQEGRWEARGEHWEWVDGGWAATP